MPYVLTCGDEGIQINEGTRIAFLGAGLQAEGFDEVIEILKDLFDEDLRIAASQENDWTKHILELNTWEQADASMQQHVQALADKHDLKYSGVIPFADPKELKHEIKGHMVRPHGIHIGTSICFTLDGGEQKYHLGQYLISAEWVSKVKPERAKEIIDQQIDFYKQVAGGRDLKITSQMGGDLGKELAEANQAVLEELGYEPELTDFTD